MVKIERCPVAPTSLAIEREKANGSYAKPDVIRQLRKDFHGKCYLCEIDELQTVQIEHLKPHYGGKIRTGCSTGITCFCPAATAIM